MNSSIVRRQKIRKTPLQPIDRHLAEIGDLDGSTYINAGIDSTWYVQRQIFTFLIIICFLELVVKNAEERYINLPTELWFRLHQIKQNER